MKIRNFAGRGMMCRPAGREMAGMKKAPRLRGFSNIIARELLRRILFLEIKLCVFRAVGIRPV